MVPGKLAKVPPVRYIRTQWLNHLIRFNTNEYYASCQCHRASISPTQKAPALLGTDILHCGLTSA